MFPGFSVPTWGLVGQQLLFQPTMQQIWRNRNQANWKTLVFHPVGEIPKQKMGPIRLNEHKGPKLISLSLPVIHSWTWYWLIRLALALAADLIVESSEPGTFELHLVSAAPLCYLSSPGQEFVSFLVVFQKKTRYISQIKQSLLPASVSLSRPQGFFLYT